MTKLIALTATFLSINAFAVDCGMPIPKALDVLNSSKSDPDARAEVGSCLLENYLNRGEVAKAALKIIQNKNEDLLLREDLITAFASADLRKKEKVAGNLAPEMGQQERDAVDRTLASANNLLAVSHAVKVMDDVLPVTKYESEYFRALSEIALDETNHVLLRAAAIEALEKSTVSIYESGFYDAKLVRLTHDTLRNVAVRDDAGSYYSGASMAFERLDNSDTEMFADISSSRHLSSVKKR